MISELKMHEDMFSIWKGDCDSNQCPWWSGIYDTCLDSKRLGFDPPLRQRNFSDHVTYSANCYSIECGSESPYQVYLSMCVRSFS